MNLKEKEVSLLVEQMKGLIAGDAAGQLMLRVLELEQALPKTATITLGTIWAEDVPFTQIVNITGIKATHTPVIGVNFVGKTEIEMAQIKAEWAKIQHAMAEDGGIIFYTYQKPNTSLPLIVTFGG